MYEGMKSMAMKILPDTGVSQESEPVYPFNLSMTLEDHHLNDLGVDCSDPDCEVGNYIHLHILAEIKGIHKTDSGTSLNLQVTHMCVENESEEEQEYNEDAVGAY